MKEPKSCIQYLPKALPKLFTQGILLLYSFDISLITQFKCNNAVRNFPTLKLSLELELEVLLGKSQ